MNWHEKQNTLQVKKWKFSIGGIVSTAAFKKKKVQNCIYDTVDRPSV